MLCNPHSLTYSLTHALTDRERGEKRERERERESVPILILDVLYHTMPHTHHAGLR